MSEDDSKRDNNSEHLDQTKAKRRDREASEERLIEAAIHAFAKYGYNGATTKEIGQRAKVNESLIGRYFDGKEGLLLTILERFILEMKSEELPYPIQDNLKSELSAYVAFKMSRIEKRKALAKIIISKTLTDDSFRKKSLARVPKFCDEKLLGRLKDLQIRGDILPSIDVKIIVDSMERYLQGQVLFGHLTYEQPFDQVLSECRQFIDILSSSPVLVPTK